MTKNRELISSPRNAVVENAFNKWQARTHVNPEDEGKGFDAIEFVVSETATVSKSQM